MGTAQLRADGGIKMSIQELEALLPQRQGQGFTKTISQSQRRIKRTVKRSRNHLVAAIRRQYYLTNALSDAKKAYLLNEDISLASLIITGFLSFSVISVLANAIYTFALAASVISAILGINLVILMMMAFSTVGVLLFWTSALLQNMVSISLIEGATRKQKRSLKLTMSKSLSRASKTSAAWILLLSAAAVPAGMITLSTIIVTHMLGLSLSASLPYIIAAAVTALLWIIWVLANFSLMPYVVLFEKPANWQAAFSQSYFMVRRKGRLFLASGIFSLLALFALLYGLSALFQKVFNLDSTIIFLVLSIAGINVANAILTMFYRKRRLARK
jgi:hypothetical protein